MKVTGVFRPVDNLGRLVIPKEIRSTYGISDGTQMEFFLEGDMICIRKENQPLTLKELKRMEGEPVFVVPLELDDLKRFGKQWCVMDKDGAYIPGVEYTHWDLKHYGKTWRAHRYRPVGLPEEG